jgi:hypothetical protein
LNPLGDWTTQADLPNLLFEALGAEVVMQMAAKGDGEAQFSQGCVLVLRADGSVGTLGGSGRSPLADVGLALSTYVSQPLIVSRRVDAITWG